MSKKSIEFTLEGIEQAAEKFLNETNSKQFAFYGGMGAGKTTFITALCGKLKAIDLVSSPTFSIVNEYETKSGSTIYHFDFYRIKDPEELFDIGFEEYTETNNWCFIEWPEKGEGIIPDSFITVNIKVEPSGKRVIEF